MNVLFVCTGNTCRSPMAEALMKYKSPGMLIQSAGIFAGENGRANHHAMKALKQKGITLDHLSQPVTDKLLHWADLVITMTTQHKQSLIMEYPNFQDKYYTLKEYVSAGDEQVWEELKKANADLEEKKSQFIHQYQRKLDNNVLVEKLQEHLEEDINTIRKLEASLISYDISDPFGGDFSTYQKTLNELEVYIELLLQKIDENY